MPKVLHIGPCDSPGGMANVMRILAEHPPEGWDAELLASHVAGSPWAKWRAYRRARSTLIGMLKDPKRKPDVVHLHTAADWSWWRKRRFAYLAHGAGSKVVVHIHSGKFDTWLNSCSLRKQRLIRDTLQRPMTTGVVLSNAWKSRLESQLGELLVVFNPIKPGLEPPTEPRSKNNLLLLGRNSAVKGHDFAIELSNHLRSEFPELTLTLTGRNLAEPNWIRALGWVTEDEKLRLLQNSTILLVPSEYEGQPMVVLEALACGLPVCVSDRLVDIPKGVEAADYGDIEHWAKVISGLLKSPPDAITLLESSQPYRIESISNEWKRVYESAIEL
jgi:polysaccharide biosynthesis protein VpsI